MASLRLKPYPSCGCTHPAIDATLDLVRSTELRPEAGPGGGGALLQVTYDLVGAPFQVRSNPQADAQFSIPYTVAAAIRRRRSSWKTWRRPPSRPRHPGTGVASAGGGGPGR